MPAAKRTKKQPKFIKVGEGMKRLPANAKDYVAFVHVASLLMFTATDLGRYSFEGAIQAAADCRVMGQKDWFLPDDVQGQLFLDRSKKWGEMTDPVYRGEVGWMWVNQPCASASDCAYYVDLGSGSVYWSDRALQGLAVACRRMSPRQASALGI